MTCFANRVITCQQRNGVVENRTNRIYEAGVGVKQKMKKLCLCRQASMIAGDKFGDPDCLVTI